MRYPFVLARSSAVSSVETIRETRVSLRDFQGICPGVPLHVAHRTASLATPSWDVAVKLLIENTTSKLQWAWDDVPPLFGLHVDAEFNCVFHLGPVQTNQLLVDCPSRFKRFDLDRSIIRPMQSRCFERKPHVPRHGKYAPHARPALSAGGIARRPIKLSERRETNRTGGE